MTIAEEAHLYEIIFNTDKQLKEIGTIPKTSRCPGFARQRFHRQVFAQP